MNLKLKHQIKEWEKRLFEKIREELPEDAAITDFRFEGSKIVVYSREPQRLIFKKDLIKKIVRKYHKRIEIRSDPSVREDKKSTEKKIRSMISDEAGIHSIRFEEDVGKVIITAEKPGILIGSKGINRKAIILRTKWTPVIKRDPPIESSILNYIRKMESINSKDRQNFLRDLGRRIHRPYIFKDNKVRVSFLGGGREVGRNALLVQTRESNILVDVGMKVGVANPENLFPKLNLPEFSINDLDGIVITHAHLDHSAMAPFLVKYGYEGPIYCTKPTKQLMVLLQRDYLSVAEERGTPKPYSYSDIDKMISQTITFNYQTVNDIAPDVRLTLYNAGHILGSAIPHLHIAEGLHNIVIASDIKFSKTRLLDRAHTEFPRVETLILESTYGGERDVKPPQRRGEQEMSMWINRTIKEGGKVIIPVLGVGRAQEIMLALYKAVNDGTIPEVPVYLAGMLKEVNAIHTANPEFLSRRLSNKILHKNENPFLADFFIYVEDHSHISNIVNSDSPAIILSTNGMLQGGPVLEFVRQLAGSKRNTLLLVSYQAKGTLGRKLQEGADMIHLSNRRNKKESIEVNMKVERISGFSGHSDRRKLEDFLKSIDPSPSRVFAIHGNPRKCKNMARRVNQILKIKGRAPRNMDSIRIF